MTNTGAIIVNNNIDVAILKHYFYIVKMSYLYE